MIVTTQADKITDALNERFDFRMTSGNPRFFKCRDESVKSNRMRK